MATSIAKSRSMDDDSCTLFVGNVPKHVKKEKLEEIFSEIGSLKRCFIVTEKGNTTLSKGFAYVTFVSNSDAQRAISEIKTIDGVRINIKLAPKKNPEDNTSYKKKEKSKIKSARLIIRNLSFKATENDIKKIFSKYGKISEVVIPKKNDGKMFGFGFVQFFDMATANKALEEMNSQKILGRPVAVDWALPKDKYLDLTNKQPKNDEDSEPKNSKDEDDDDNESIESDEDKIQTKKRKVDEDGSEDSENSSEDDSDSENDDSENEDSDDEDEEDSEEMESDDDESKSKKRKLSNDVIEGKTLFIRNLSFNVTKEDLANTFGEFGKVKYAVICMDPDTEHSKGTAFVKFEDKNSADTCLQKANSENEDDGVFVDGTKVTVCLAMSRDEMMKKQEAAKKKFPKDSRNLYLAREGLIRPGTAAAEGVSVTDMHKRSKLEIWKSQMLKNFNTFISDTRLCVRNLPMTLKDESLRKIFLKAAGNEAKVTEARVIKNRTDNSEFGESKGYGFVTFANHEQALKALRETNNNPDIFSKKQRPIVEFSIEKKGALKAKLKRLEQSRKNLNLPKKSNKTDKWNKNRKRDEFNQNVTKEKLYMGAKGRPGSKRILPAFRGKQTKNPKKMKKVKK